MPLQIPEVPQTQDAERALYDAKCRQTRRECALAAAILLLVDALLVACVVVPILALLWRSLR